MTFKVYLDDTLAVVPSRGDPLAAGYDLTSIVHVVIQPRSQSIVDTGLIIEFPSDCYGRVAPRSGLAAKHCINVHAGVIDASYRGRVKVILFNNSDKAFEVKVGDRIAQLIYEKIYTPTLEVANHIDDMTSTVRGGNGFGSTGV